MAAPESAPCKGLRAGIRTFIESRPAQHAITALIVINAAVLALETSPAAMAAGLVSRARTAALITIRAVMACCAGRLSMNVRIPARSPLQGALSGAAMPLVSGYAHDFLRI